jgi:hypothetical protein
VESDEKLSLDPVASPEFLGPIRSHVSAADDRGPLANFFQLLGEDYSSFYRYERIRASIVLDAQGGKERSGEIATFYGISACVEDDVPVVIGDKPNRGDVWPPIDSGGGERPRARWSRRKKGFHFLVGHQVVGHQVVLARERSHASLPRNRTFQAPKPIGDGMTDCPTYPAAYWDTQSQPTPRPESDFVGYRRFSASPYFWGTYSAPEPSAFEVCSEVRGTSAPSGRRVIDEVTPVVP